ncbi:hypothetical protein [Enterococcus ratti]|uniref:Uncharacterized protein n=1 Tax=Enterococcus ratti TaxID=150033 RepID=A0A1L8W7I9_9ENTE|nr:hypothetical protein [Enterococcus ratti]OJG77029.1 hypothetical protein RV14_GL001753 [Enterococcus ratti]
MERKELELNAEAGVKTMIDSVEEKKEETELEFDFLWKVWEEATRFHPYSEEECYFDLLTMLTGFGDVSHNSNLQQNEKFALPLLFSIYAKMIEQDENEFFIDKNKRPQVIDSLKRTIKYCRRENDSNEVQELLQTLATNEPASFVILPISYNIQEEEDLVDHVGGLLIHKKDEDYLVTIVDKQAFFYNKQIGNYVFVSQNKLPQLVQILEESKLSDDIQEPFKIFKQMAELSNEKQFVSLPIVMRPQLTENCMLSEPEATLKVALFHCRKNIFERTSAVHVKWNDFPHSTEKMRERFLHAILADVEKDSRWYSRYKQVFHYYKMRKEGKKERLKENNEDVLKDIKEVLQRSLGLSEQVLDHVRKAYQKDPLIQSANEVYLREEVMYMRKLIETLVNLNEEFIELDQNIQMMDRSIQTIGTKLNTTYLSEELKEIIQSKDFLLENTNKCLKYKCDKIRDELKGKQIIERIDTIKEAVADLRLSVDPYLHRVTTNLDKCKANTHKMMGKVKEKKELVDQLILLAQGSERLNQQLNQLRKEGLLNKKSTKNHVDTDYKKMNDKDR